MDLAAEVSKSYGFLEGVSGNITILEKAVKQAQIYSKLTVQKVQLTEVNGWGFESETGNYVHETGRFFSLQAIEGFGESIPILVQPEVGVLGFIAYFFDGILHFLVQLKIEPGNENGIQLSPTVQATRSNYTQIHGGKLPQYLEYFMPGRSGVTLCDQYGSEQGWRYYQKKNRNIIVLPDAPPEAVQGYQWMTLGQISALSQEPLLLNACARSVLSFLPRFVEKSEAELHSSHHNTMEIQTRLIDAKEFDSRPAQTAPLGTLKNWGLRKGKYACQTNPDFQFIGVQVNGANREVDSWSQPLLQESGIGEYGLILGTINGVPHAFWKIRHEPGLFGRVEIGPSWLCRSSSLETDTETYRAGLTGKSLLDLNLAEEGGRFFGATFRHRVVWVREVRPKDFGPDILPLTPGQTDKCIQSGGMVTIEARSLWTMTKEEWFG